MKISEAFEQFRRLEIRGRGYSPNTDKSYQYVESTLIRYFGDISIRKIDLAAITDFYLATTGEDATECPFRLSKNTAREYISRLKTVFRYCQMQGIRVLNPDKIVLPRLEKKYARFIDCHEYDRFIDEVGRPRRGYPRVNLVRNVLICKILFNTGLRVSELCALNRNSIHDRQFVVVGKSKDPRPCYITKEIEDDINAYLAMRNDDSMALFVSNETGERITPHTVQLFFRRLSKTTGIKVTPHTLRHGFATHLLEEGVDIRYVAAFLGHQNIDTTKRYTHVRDFKMQQIYKNVFEMG